MGEADDQPQAQPAQKQIEDEKANKEVFIDDDDPELDIESGKQIFSLKSPPIKHCTAELVNQSRHCNIPIFLFSFQTRRLSTAPAAPF